MRQPDFGIELVKIRNARGLTQSELAEECKVSKRTIQRIESGSVGPHSYTIKALSTALGFDFLKDSPNEISENTDSDNKESLIHKKVISQAIDLFNLKTNAMRKLSILTLIVGLTAIGLFIISSQTLAQNKPEPKSFISIDSNVKISKKDAIKTINRIKRKAPYHNEAIDVIKTYAEKSNFNHDTYVLLSKLIGSFGYSTKYLMEIGNTVFLSHRDCDMYNDIAPLIFLNKNGSSIYGADIYVDLAKEASEAETDDDKEKLRVLIEKYRVQGEFKTLEEAFNSQYSAI